MEIVQTLRHRGGPHSTQKGVKGYNRKKVVPIRARDYNKDLALFLSNNNYKHSWHSTKPNRR